MGMDNREGIDCGTEGWVGRRGAKVKKCGTTDRINNNLKNKRKNS